MSITRYNDENFVEALKLSKEGKYRESLEYLKFVSEPDRASVLILKARCLRKLNENAEAASILKILKQKPHVHPNVRQNTLIDLSHCYIALYKKFGDRSFLEKEESLMKELLKEFPHDPFAVLENIEYDFLANCEQADASRFISQLDLLKKTIVNTQNKSIWRLVYELEIRIHDYYGNEKEKLAITIKCLENYKSMPNNAAYVAGLERLAYKTPDILPCIEPKKFNPSSTASDVLRTARLCEQIGEFSQAQKFYDQYSKENQYAWKGQISCAYFFQKFAGELEKSKLILTQIIQFDPDCPKELLEDMELDKSCPEDKRPELEEIKKAYATLQVSYISSQEYEKAKLCGQRAIELGNIKSLSTKAKFLTGKAQEKAYLEVQQADPKNFDRKTLKKTTTIQPLVSTYSEAPHLQPLPKSSTIAPAVLKPQNSRERTDEEKKELQIDTIKQRKKRNKTNKAEKQTEQAKIFEIEEPNFSEPIPTPIEESLSANNEIGVEEISPRAEQTPASAPLEVIPKQKASSVYCNKNKILFFSGLVTAVVTAGVVAYSKLTP